MNVIACGNYSHKFNIGGITLVSADTFYSAPSSDGFVAKFDTDGKVAWAQTLSGINHQAASFVRTDQQGNVYVAGSVATSITINNELIYTNDGGYYHDHPFLLVVKYSANG